MAARATCVSVAHEKMRECDMGSFGRGPKMGMIEPKRVPCMAASTRQWGGLTWQLVVPHHVEEARRSQKIVEGRCDSSPGFSPAEER